MNNVRELLLSIKNLHVNFRARDSILHVIRGIDLDIRKGESIAVVGESGSGKSVLSKTITGMLEPNGFVEQGSALFYDDGTCDLIAIRGNKAWQPIRGSKIATVPQDPMTGLNPIITIGKQISSVIIAHRRCGKAKARAEAVDMIKRVGIPDAENRYDDYPFQYSGGMRQRIAIAIALCCRPKLLICDEPTTALDVTMQAQILRLFEDLQKEFGYTLLFITHDLGVVAHIAERVAVMYAGQMVELGTAEDIFYDARHPYTWALLSSLPQLAQKPDELYAIKGTPPSPYESIVGDAFAPRNPYRMKIDTLLEPPLFKISDTHYAKTWLLDARAPRVEKPAALQNLHARLKDSLPL